MNRLNRYRVEIGNDFREIRDDVRGFGNRYRNEGMVLRVTSLVETSSETSTTSPVAYKDEITVVITFIMTHGRQWQGYRSAAGVRMRMVLLTHIAGSGRCSDRSKCRG